MQSKMTAGQALDWMTEHPGEELEDNDGGLWRRLGRSLQRHEPDGMCWVRVDIGSTLPCLSWSIPERRLPKLPDGSEYVLDDDASYVRCDDGHCFWLAKSGKHAAIYRALADEFATRPK